jgi:CRP-like cAMP-binding protein
MNAAIKLKPSNCSDRAVAEMIDATTWANEFDWEEVLKLGGYFTAYEVGAGETIFEEGDKTAYMALIISGRIRISKRDSQDKTKSLITLGASQTFGELSLVDSSPRSAKAQALEPSRFVVTTRRQLFRMSEKEPALAFKLMWLITQSISLRLRSTSYLLVDAGS